MVNSDDKQFFDKVRKYASGVTRIALTGGSGAGKTTSLTRFMERFPRQFIYSNIGAVQSSKLRMAVVPIHMKEKQDNCCLDIRYAETPYTELVMRATRSAIVDKLKTAFRSFDDSEDVKDIVDEFLEPDNGAYSIKIYCNEANYDKLMVRVKEVCRELLKGLNEKLNALKREAEKKGEKFNLKEAVNKELDLRISGYSLDEIEKIIGNVIIKIRKKIEEKLEELRERGLDVEQEYNRSSVYFDEETTQIVDEMFKFLFQKDGKDMVISSLYYFVPCSREMKDVFYPENKPLSNRDIMPCVVLYDQKGLEAGTDSIDESILKLRDSIPDAILLYQRTTDIKDYILKYISEIQLKFKNVPLYGILTHSDEALKAYLRSGLEGVGSIPEDAQGYEDFYRQKVFEAYNQLRKDNEIYETKIRKGDEEDTVIFCSLVNESKEIDGILGGDALYQSQRIIRLVKKIYEAHKSLWAKIQISDDQRDLLEQISFSFDESRLQSLAEKFVADHKANAEKQYYSQRRLYPHWNSVYKWRAMHRVGGGWTSDAMVYDNISIYIGNVISGIINKDNIVNAIKIDFPSEFTIEQRDNCRERLMANIKKDMELYNGLFYKIKLALSYSGFKDRFESTYYSDALDRIHEHLSDEKYIKKTLADTLKEYTQVILTRTFE